MKQEYEKYITENIRTKSIRDIARELGIKERYVRKFIHRQRQGRAIDGVVIREAPLGTSSERASRSEVREWGKEVMRNEAGQPRWDKSAGTSGNIIMTVIKRKIVIFSVLLIILTGFLVYGGMVKAEFVWDDEYLIEKNRLIKDWSNFPELFSGLIGAGGNMDYSSYRPIQIATYMIEYHLWGLDPRGYHATNIILHILAALCLWWMLNVFFNDNFISLLSGMLFVTAPAHIAAVSYISGRADPLALLFMLLGLIFYAKAVTNGRLGFFITAAVLFSLALFSRENGIIFPALVALYHYTFGKKYRRGYILTLLSIPLLYFLIRVVYLNALLPHVSCPTTFFERLPGAFASTMLYLKLIIFPSSLHMEYGQKIFSFLNALALAGIIFVISIIYFAITRKDRDKVLFFSVFWGLITYLPVSNLYPIGFYMTEHWMYVPSAGIFLAISLAVRRLYRERFLKVPSLILAACFIVFYSFITIKHNANWKDPVSFYEWTLKYAPSSARTYLNLGRAYKNKGRYDDAIRSFKRALEIDPNYTKVYNNLAVVYHEKRMINEAIDALKKAIELDPSYGPSYNNLASVYKGIGRRDEAIQLFFKALENSPYYAGTVYYNLALLYFENKEYDKAIKYADLAERNGFAINPELSKLLLPFRK